MCEVAPRFLCMFQQKLKAAIQDYLDKGTQLSRSKARTVITKLINGASVTEMTLVPSVLQGFEVLPEWLNLRFQKGSLYKKGRRVFGWYKVDQVQAVELSVTLDVFHYDDGVDFLAVLYRSMKVVQIQEEWGFFPATDLPFYDCRVRVSFDDDNFRELHKCGYASPCDLQWSWVDKEGYVVERSIISHGFWKAWEWWPECWQFYYKKWPELFQDAEWWATDVDSGQTV